MAEQSLFHWLARDRFGHSHRGQIRAHSATAARIALYHKGLHAEQLRSRAPPRIKRLSAADTADLLQQLAVAAEGGVQLLAALDLTIETATRARLRERLASVRSAVTDGVPLSNALADCLGGIDNICCRLILAGEQAGIPQLMLRRAAQHHERSLRLRHQLSQALLYPGILLLLATAVGAFLLFSVVPSFASVFADSGTELPALTRHVIAASDWLRGHGLQLLIIIATCAAAGRIGLLGRGFQASALSVCHLLPVLGGLLQKAAQARFCHVAAATLEAGLPLLESLRCAGQACGSPRASAAVQSACRQLEAGHALAAVLNRLGVLSPLMIRMITIGERSGRLVPIFSLLAERCETEAEASSHRLATLLEPAIIAVLGVLIGLLILAMYLPIFRLGNTL